MIPTRSLLSNRKTWNVIFKSASISNNTNFRLLRDNEKNEKSELINSKTKM